MVSDCCEQLLERCSCNCHTNKNVIHCAPCCSVCQYCSANIRFSFIDSHIEQCKKKYNNIRVNLVISDLLDTGLI